MQKEKEGLLSISEFAGLVGASRSQLLFYDRKGVFRPAAYQEAGGQAANRRYRLEQVAQYHLFTFLQQLGCTLEEASSWTERSFAECVSLLSEREKKLQQDMNRLTVLQESIALIRDMQRVVSDKTAQRPAFITLEERPAFYVPFEKPCLRGTPQFSKEYGRYFQLIKQKPAILPAPIGLVQSVTDPQDGKYPVKAMVLLLSRAASHEANYRLPAGRYLAFQMSGPLGTGHENVIAGRSYLLQHGLRRSSEVILWNMGIQNIREQSSYTEFAAYRVCRGETEEGQLPIQPGIG